jgi:ATP-dependent DNA helicase RecG
MRDPSIVPIRYLKGIGPKRARIFAKLGLNNVEDLFYYFPKRYEDRANFSAISELKEGQIYTIKAKILVKGERRSFRRRGFSITEVIVGDESGKISCVWFNQAYLKEYFQAGKQVILYGKAERYGNKLQLSNPEFEIIGDDDGQDQTSSDLLNIGRIVPVYSLPEGISQRNFRGLIQSVFKEYLPELRDFLPFDIRSRNNLLNLAKSLLNIHFPQDFSLKQEACERLSFEEFFLFQLPLALRKLKNKKKPGIAHNIEGALVGEFILKLPFKLTSAQERVIEEIKLDMARPQAMHRLLQGDVGSGKTVVAAVSSLIAIQGGYQAAIMAPTEILARQHFGNFKAWFSGFGFQGEQTQIGLLTGNLNKQDKDDIRRKIESGKINLVIGTHALLEEQIKFKNLGLVVIDEQHKFGVGQRALLPHKAKNPDILIMTATPIPRTLAITLYGDLDISVINELPVGRKVVQTIHLDPKGLSEAFVIAKRQIEKGRQVYLVYPVIDESYALDIAGAKKMYEQLRSGEFKEFNVGLVHGRMKNNQQDQVMLKFKNREIDLLVSTTVLEVGIDIPNATCMIIEHAQRFGLSQLHQLRGRVGRADEESFCLLICDPLTLQSRARLEAMLKYSDGFRIAEEDLKIRGPGEFFGLRQSGLSELKIANPLTQMRLLKKAREEAIRLINFDSRLEMKQNTGLKDKLLQRFPEYEKLIVVG